MLFSSSDSDSDPDDWDEKEDEASGNPVRILIGQSVRVAIAVQGYASYLTISRRYSRRLRRLIVLV